jgi:nicotinamidase/pyrazinamidase
MSSGTTSPQSRFGAVEGRDPGYGPHVVLVVVDVQNDFADPAGSLYVNGGSEIVATVNAEVESAIGAGATVVYTQDWHPSHTPHFAQDGGIWPVHCVADTWGAALHKDLLVRGPIIRKGTQGEDGYSGFSMRNPTGGETIPTELGPTLARELATRIVVCGLATDYCVKATALDGIRLGYETTVLVDAVRAVNLTQDDGERALDELVAAGVVLLRRRSPAG